jgi:two-component system chemotaxis response regulator CheY
LISVLVVDDAAFMRLAIKNVLTKHGFNVVADAKNGQEGVEKYKEFKPDVVTMDITMPDMTGIEALKLIREFDPGAKVVMISAMGQESMVKEAILSGAKSFIVKPYKETYYADAAQSGDEELRGKRYGAGNEPGRFPARAVCFRDVAEYAAAGTGRAHSGARRRFFP